MKAIMFFKIFILPTSSRSEPGQASYAYTLYYDLSNGISEA